MPYLDVEVLSEAIRRVGNRLNSLDRNLDSPEASTLIALVYERLIRGEASGRFFDLFSEYQAEGRK